MDGETRERAAEDRALEACARFYWSDIDAPHMLRDLARACRLESQRELARRLTSLAACVADAIEVGEARARTTTEGEP